MSPDTHIPHWEWYYIALYFYIGGVSAGAYFIGALAELFGNEKKREISRIAFSIAFPLILITPILLIADLGRPERFWHLFLYSKSGIPYINWESPLSVGSWALMAYGGFALFSYLDNLVSDGRVKVKFLENFYTNVARKISAVFGSATGFFVASYTGVLLNVTALPLWEATDPLLGPLFIASGASTGAAVISLIMARRNMTSSDAFGQLEKFDRIAMILELLLIIATIVIAGQYAAPLMKGFYAVMFWGGTVLLGILLPLALYWYAARPGVERSKLVILTAVLVLIGGALLRISLIQAGQI